MAYIGQNPIDAFRGLASYDTFTGDGATVNFDLAKVAPIGGQNDILVVVNNVIQEPGVTKSYTLGVVGSGDNKRVTFNSAPVSGDAIYVINPGKTTSVLQPSPNSITASMIYTGALRSLFTSGTFTGDGSSNTITINSGRAVNDVLVYVNGVCLVPTTDYTISSTTLTFTTIPANGAEIVVRYLG